MQSKWRYATFDKICHHTAIFARFVFRGLLDAIRTGFGIVPVRSDAPALFNLVVSKKQLHPIWLFGELMWVPLSRFVSNANNCEVITNRYHVIIQEFRNKDTNWWSCGNCNIKQLVSVGICFACSRETKTGLGLWTPSYAICECSLKLILKAVTPKKRIYIYFFFVNANRNLALSLATHRSLSL